MVIILFWSSLFLLKKELFELHSPLLHNCFFGVLISSFQKFCIGLYLNSSTDYQISWWSIQSLLGTLWSRRLPPIESTRTFHFWNLEPSSSESLSDTAGKRPSRASHLTLAPGSTTRRSKLLHCPLLCRWPCFWGQWLESNGHNLKRHPLLQ